MDEFSRGMRVFQVSNLGPNMSGTIFSVRPKTNRIGVIWDAGHNSYVSPTTLHIHVKETE